MIKKYKKKIIIGLVLIIVTFGLYGVYKLIKRGDA